MPHPRTPRVVLLLTVLLIGPAAAQPAAPQVFSGIDHGDVTTVALHRDGRAEYLVSGVRPDGTPLNFRASSARWHVCAKAHTSSATRKQTSSRGYRCIELEVSGMSDGQPTSFRTQYALGESELREFTEQGLGAPLRLQNAR